MDDIIEYFSNKLNEIDYKKLIFPTIIILLYIGGFFYFQTISRNIKQDSNKIETKNEINEEKELTEISIDVKGEVSSPGVYKLKYGERVVDAITMAGGLTNNANTRFINLSKTLEDGDVIVIYSNSEIENAKKDNVVYVETPCVCEEIKNDGCYKETSYNININGKININSATKEELQSLSGIGESKARAIIEYRNKFGNFKSIDEIKNVSGISETIYSKIKENITV